MGQDQIFTLILVSSHCNHQQQIRTCDLLCFIVSSFLNVRKTKTKQTNIVVNFEVLKKMTKKCWLQESHFFNL